jgi:hypothetical protein
VAKKEAKANGKALRARGMEWNTHLKPYGKKLVARLRRRAGKLITRTAEVS